MNNNTENYYSPKQGRLPLFISNVLDICDPVLTFDRIMEEIEIVKYLKPESFSRLGRPLSMKNSKDPYRISSRP